MKLLVQPGDGIKPLLSAIQKAQKSIEIAIFRFDLAELERALMEAIKRGVAVHALIACTNRGGEKTLRALEARLLAAGAIVARTANDLARYHGKFIIVDARDLYLLGFNFARADLRSRSFGLIVRNPSLVHDAARLFKADSTRQPYTVKAKKFVVSPVNAREQLSEFIAGAKKSLWIYDPEISDPSMTGLLEERAKAGVDVKIIGELSRRIDSLKVRSLNPMRLHVRLILRDEDRAFLGSQSLRAAELDRRREVGLIFQDRAIANRLGKIFDEDWTKAKTLAAEEVPAEKVAKKVAKLVTKRLPDVTAVLNEVVAIETKAEKLQLDKEGLEESVKDAVKSAVRDAVQEVVKREAGAKV
ncbi:MAG: Phosphatidylserine/phosphatidylglycerophosphate/cardiolipin synthase -like [Bryobacterales bacterium]|nr:Phosphatidylserine/phosphatidylglycerophosphate/cardiolipin synthase -like [Bryobacterales bacterium]